MCSKVIIVEFTNKKNNNLMIVYVDLQCLQNFIQNSFLALSETLLPKKLKFSSFLHKNY